jgi:dihydroorotase
MKIALSHESSSSRYEPAGPENQPGSRVLTSSAIRSTAKGGKVSRRSVSRLAQGIGFLFLILFLQFSFSSALHAQQIDILLKGGHVIDPKNEIDGLMDVAIANGEIVRVASSISESGAEMVIDVTGLYVTPGIIDIHGHYYHGTEPGRSYSDSFAALPPDGFTFRSGVTTSVSVGGAGWRNFPHFKEQVIDRSRTRILSFINIVGDGMSGLPEQNIDDMNARMTGLMANRYSDYIVGVKLAHFDASDGADWRTTVSRSIEAAEMADIPIMVDFGFGRPSIEELFTDFYRPGDIFTHAFHPGPWKEPIVDWLEEDGVLKPFVVEAQERGILFEVGHGGGSFSFIQAIPAFEQGFKPDLLGSDLHRGSMNAGLKDMSNLMSKFMAIGLTLDDVILRSTWNNAKAINRTELGHLSEGAIADVAVFRVRNGEFGYVDSRGWKLEGNEKLEAELTILDVNIVWDLNGISRPLWDTQPRPDE